jgi:hypothetical protein
MAGTPFEMLPLVAAAADLFAVEPHDASVRAISRARRRCDACADDEETQSHANRFH